MFHHFQLFWRFSSRPILDTPHSFFVRLGYMKYQHQSGQYVSILKYQSKITPAMGAIHIIYGFQWSILNTVLNVGNLVMEIKLWIYGCFLKQGYPKTMVGNSYAHTWFCGMLHFLTHLRTPLGLVYTHRTTQDHTGVGLGWSFVGLCSLSLETCWGCLSLWTGYLFLVESEIPSSWGDQRIQWSLYQRGQLDQKHFMRVVKKQKIERFPNAAFFLARKCSWSGVQFPYGTIRGARPWVSHETLLIFARFAHNLAECGRSADAWNRRMLIYHRFHSPDHTTGRGKSDSCNLVIKNVYVHLHTHALHNGHVGLGCQ